MTLACLVSQFFTEFGPAQLQLVCYINSFMKRPVYIVCIGIDRMNDTFLDDKLVSHFYCTNLFHMTSVTIFSN